MSLFDGLSKAEILQTAGTPATPPQDRCTACLRSQFVIDCGCVACAVTGVRWCSRCRIHFTPESREVE
jgi:hypothetical protein